MQTISEFIVDLELSSICNLNCIFCFRDQIKRTSPFLGEEAVDHLIKHLDGHKVVWFSGMGEPFLHPHIAAIVAKIKGSGAKIYSNTNGTAPEFKRRLPECIQNGLDFVNVSIYGLDRVFYQGNTGKDVFELVKQNVNFLRESGLSHRISYVCTEATPENIKERLQDIFEVENIRLLSRHHRSRADKESVFSYRCGLVENYLFISSDGHIFSCVNDVAGINNFGRNIIQAAQAKRAGYPFTICQHCDSGKGRNSLATGFAEKVLNLGMKK